MSGVTGVTGVTGVIEVIGPDWVTEVTGVTEAPNVIICFGKWQNSNISKAEDG